MIRQSQFRRFQARYHRNGVAGEGFHLCSFLFTRGNLALVAVVYETPGHVAVINPVNIAERFRGDDFEKALREAIEAVEEAQPESIHSQDHQR